MDLLERIESAKKEFGATSVLINYPMSAGNESIYDFKNKKPHSTDQYRGVFETDMSSLLNDPDLSKQIVIKPVLLVTMPDSPLPEPDSDGIWKAVVIPIPSKDLRAGILALFSLPKEKSVTVILVLRLEFKRLGIFIFIPAMKKKSIYAEQMHKHSQSIHGYVYLDVNLFQSTCWHKPSVV